MNTTFFELRIASMLNNAWGTENVGIRTATLLKDGSRCRVYRCELEPGNPPTVIVKQKKEGPESLRFFTDWSSLSFLSQLPGAEGVTSDFYSGDSEEGITCIEDLGGSRSLETLLLEGGAEESLNAFRRMAVKTACMHRATNGKEDEFLKLRRELPGSHLVDRTEDACLWRKNREKAEAWFAAAGCRIPVGFEECYETIASVYEAPGPFLAFTHGDFAPSNSHVSEGEVKLLDFEYGGYRHALYDLTAYDILCPMPEPWIGEIRRVYQEALAVEGAEARDEEEFQGAWAAMCAYRALAILSWISPEILSENRPRVGDEWTCRHAVLSAAARSAARVRGIGSLEPYAEGMDVLARQLRMEWPEITPLCTGWPAFDR